VSPKKTQKNVFEGSCPVPESRLPLADDLFDSLDERGKGLLDLERLCLLINQWEPDFGRKAMMSTFKTCGAKAQGMDKKTFYKWIAKVIICPYPPSKFPVSHLSFQLFTTLLSPQSYP